MTDDVVVVLLKCAESEPLRESNMIEQRFFFGQKVLSGEIKMQECDNKMEQVKSKNEVVERVTTARAWFLRAESTKW